LRLLAHVLRRLIRILRWVVNQLRVARYLARTAFPGVVVIHSKHEAGANAMKVHLPQASLAPFGTFEIEISEVFASELR
jgi:hypothetical protein